MNSSPSSVVNLLSPQKFNTMIGMVCRRNEVDDEPVLFEQRPCVDRADVLRYFVRMVVVTAPFPWLRQCVQQSADSEL